MQTKKRIEYLDAMRGLTMILVVYSHVHLFSFNLFKSLGGGKLQRHLCNGKDAAILFRQRLFARQAGRGMDTEGCHSLHQEKGKDTADTHFSLYVALLLSV